jgi:hypothetical protein
MIARDPDGRCAGQLRWVQVALGSIALGSIALGNNNRSRIDKRVTDVTCHAGFHGAKHLHFSDSHFPDS